MSIQALRYLLIAGVSLAELLCFCGLRAAEPDTIESFSVTTTSGWILRINRDGSGRLQFGSSPMDATLIPKGACDFSSTVSRLTEATQGEAGSKVVAVAFRKQNEVSVTTIPLAKPEVGFNLLKTMSEKATPLDKVRFAELMNSRPFAGENPAEKWITPADGLKRLCPASRVAYGKLVLKTLEKGGRLLYSINDGEKKLAALGEEITLEKGQKLAIIERHTQIEIVPLVADGKTRFGVIVREDYRSFGKELTVSTSAFDLGSDDIVAVPEVEGRAALAAAKTKPTNK